MEGSGGSGAGRSPMLAVPGVLLAAPAPRSRPDARTRARPRRPPGPLGGVNAFLIDDGDGLTLVDAGLPGRAGRVLAAATGATVWAHAADAPVIRAGTPAHARPGQPGRPGRGHPAAPLHPQARRPGAAAALRSTAARVAAR